jgi:hypothetical protein
MWTVTLGDKDWGNNKIWLPISSENRFPLFRFMAKLLNVNRREAAMRITGAASLVAACGMLVSGVLAPARADTLPFWDTIPPFKGNDTGGIIAYPLAAQTDARQLAIDHCARYDKVVKFLAVDPQYGGYISFACRWVPYGATERPLRTRY